MRHLQNGSRRRGLLRLAGLALPTLCIALGFLWVLFGVPAGGAVRITREALAVILGLAGVGAAAGAFGVLALARQPAHQPRVTVLAAGIEDGDIELIEGLFPQSREVRLRPISGGYSGAAVFYAQGWSATAALQRTSIVKIGRFDPPTGCGERADQTFDVPVATIHGDLNSRNVLIDARGVIFVIDFANTGPGHLLRDFARMESELTLVLAVADDTALAERVRQAGGLIVAEHGGPCRTLRELLQPRPYQGAWAGTGATPCEQQYYAQIAEADADGNFRFEQVPIGVYDFTIKPEDGRWALIFFGSSIEALTPDEELTFDINLQ